MNKKFTKRFILFFLILSSCMSCCREDDLLRNTREDYIGDDIRIDGFYYSFFQGEIHNVLFLYRNGVFFKVISDEKKRTKPEEVQTLLTEDRLERYKTHKDLWGIFIIKNNNILLDKWTWAGLGWKTTVIESGTILNDTSFVITKRDNLREGIKDSNETYYFYPYSPKPDSTNIFIK